MFDVALYTKYELFVGLMYFCMEDQHAIKSLVNTLRIPSLDTRVRVL